MSRNLTRRVQRGRRCMRGSSPVMLVILILIVALFIFSSIAGSRGGMSKGGCLPTSAADRKKLSDDWFSPELPQKKHMSFNCPRVGGVLQVKGGCEINVAPSGPKLTSYYDEIKAAFSDGPRALPVEALTSAIEISVHDRDEDFKPVEATLDREGTTSITVSRAGAVISISCVECQVRIDRPKP